MVESILNNNILHAIEFWSINAMAQNKLNTHNNTKNNCQESGDLANLQIVNFFAV